MFHAVSNRYLTQRTQLSTGEILAGLDVDKLGLGVVFLPIIRIFPVSVIPPMLRKLSLVHICN